MIVYPLLCVMHSVLIPLGIVLMALPTARRKLPAGRCAGCGYDLHGLTSGRCPECAYINSGEEVEQTHLSSHIRLGIGVACVIIPFLLDAFVVLVIVLQ